MRHLFIFLIFILAFIAAPLPAQHHPNPEIHSAITEGINAMIDQDYNSARKLFSNIKKKYPQNPIGYIYSALVELSYEYDLSVEYDGAKILDLLNRAISLSEILLDQDEYNAWYNYYKGLAEGYKAYYNALDESWFSSLNSGFSAKKYFERALESDPNFYESYIAIGTWKFWKSEKTEFLNWLPFVSDERDEGIQMLKTMIAKETYHKNTAIHILAWIYIGKKQFTAAKDILEPVIKQHPNSRFFLWDIARVYEELDKSKAISIYQQILSSYQKEQMKNRCNEITLKFFIAKLNFALGEKNKAKALMKEIPTEDQLTAFEKERLGSRVDRIAQFRKTVNS